MQRAARSVFVIGRGCISFREKPREGVPDKIELAEVSTVYRDSLGTNRQPAVKVTIPLHGLCPFQVCAHGTTCGKSGTVDWLSCRIACLRRHPRRNPGGLAVAMDAGPRRPLVRLVGQARTAKPPAFAGLTCSLSDATHAVAAPSEAHPASYLDNLI